MFFKRDTNKVKIIEDMTEYKVICFDFLGFSPENGAFALFRQWLKDTKINLESEGLRVFGYNHPNPSDKSGFYGYRVCVTLNDNVLPYVGDHHLDKIQGGRYAVLTVNRQKNVAIGNSIMKSWTVLVKWLKLSPYQLSKRQWLEEHCGFDSEYNHIGNDDLYMSSDSKDE